MTPSREPHVPGPELTGARPEDVGMNRVALESAARIAASRPGSGQLTVARHGRIVLDHRWGPAQGDLRWVFSASKTVVAVLIHQLAQAGTLALDDPVALHWPEFAAAGKDGITIRHVLTHRAGLPTAQRSGSLADVRAMTSWTRSTQRFAAARPRYPAGKVPAYGYLGFGFILGEVIQRATGVPFAQLAAEQVFEPAGMTNSWFGVPAAQAGRLVPLVGRGPIGRGMAFVINRPDVPAAVIPAGGLTTTTVDLVRLYESLRTGVLLSPDGMAALVEPSDMGQRDKFVHLNVRYGQGVQLGGPRQDVLGWGPFGRDSLISTFGHNGSNVAIGWADPVRGLACAHATGLQTTYLKDFAHLAEVADAVLAATGPLDPG